MGDGGGLISSRMVVSCLPLTINFISLNFLKEASKTFHSNFLLENLRVAPKVLHSENIVSLNFLKGGFKI